MSHPLSRSRCWLAAASITFLAVTLGAQQGGGDSVEFHLVDAVTGAPILRGGACWRNTKPSKDDIDVTECVWADTTGLAYSSALKHGRYELSADCLARPGATPRSQIDTVRLRDSSRSVRVRLTVRGCDQRPFHYSRGVFRGVYSFGFEMSEFRWCADTTERIAVHLHTPGDSAIVADSGTWREQMMVGTLMPAGTPDTSRYRWQEVFIEARGTIVGLGSYGHMGWADHLFSVDSVMSASAPTSAQCGAH